ncbi:MAG TPA: SDR family oxidoreductase [bacterium]|jgi:3-oxoacyl-[acyl-carrier protein] reductase
MDLNLRDRHAICLAASRGLGYACAEALAAEGARVSLISRAATALRAAADRLQARCGRPVTTRALDINDPVALEGGLDELAATPCDILVTNCGGPPIGPFAGHSLEAWQSAFTAQLLSATIACRLLVPAMARRGWGRVVMIGSLVMRAPLAGFALSNAVRPGLAGLAKTLTLEYASAGVTVNVVCPGFTATDRIQGAAARLATDRGVAVDAVVGEWTERIPAGRLGRPEEIGALVAYLASDRAAFITGQSLLIDGGQCPGM